MALNFPSSPTAGQTHNATNGLSYYYDGVKWTVQGTYAASAGALLKIDDISSDFNGTTTTFNLHHNSSDISISSALDLTISIGGVLQEPDVAYGVNPTASTITFTGAPPAGVSFFGVLKSKLPDQNTTVTDGTIVTSKIGGTAVTTDKIANDAVTSAKLDTNIDIAGTLDVTGNTTLDSNVNIKGDSKTFTIETAAGTDKFTVASSTGNTAIVGTLAVTGKSTFTAGNVFTKVSSTLASTALAVTSGWHEINGNSNNLTTLTGGTAGQILIITAATADLTITDGAQNAGSNTIVTGGVTSLKKVNHSSTDDGADTLVLMFNGTQWLKIAHGDN